MNRYVEEKRLLITLAEVADNFNPNLLNSGYVREGIALAAKAVKEEPTADVQAIRHAYWQRQPGKDPEAVCSNCGREVVYQIIDNKWAFENFCPHCGAEMDGKEK